MPYHPSQSEAAEDAVGPLTALVRDIGILRGRSAQLREVRRQLYDLSNRLGDPTVSVVKVQADLMKIVNEIDP